MNAFFKLASAACLASVVAGQPALSAETHAFTSHFGWLSVGASHQLNEGHIYWVGEFSGSATNMGADAKFDNMAMKCPAWFDVDFPNNRTTAGGYCIATLQSGDSFFISWTCESALDGATGAGAMPFGANRCNGESTIIGGTGALSGVSGRGVLRDGMTILFHPDGKGSGSTVNEWTIALP